MVKQTAEQLAASNPITSAWVGASAGTGKTAVLSSRVLRLMLSGSRPNKILCLTYTNTAAAEMAIRVNDRLAKWVSLKDEELFVELSELLGVNPSTCQMTDARKLFAQVLDVPGGLKIQTIHSFCQSLLGRFPIEANISPNFDLLDEITIGEQLRLSRDEMLRKIQTGKDKVLRQTLNHISQLVAESTFIDLMKKLTMERGGIEYIIGNNHGSLDQVILSLKKVLGFSKSENSKSILDAACDENNFNQSGLRDAVEILLSGTVSDQKRGNIISGWLKNTTDRPERFNDYKKAFLTASTGDFYKNYMTKKLTEKHPNILDILLEEAERVKFVTDRLKVYSLFENSEAALRLGYELIKTYNKRKKNHNVMDFDDLILKVRNLFDKRNIASWILYKLDEGIDHILIDEAQDTNPDQWHVIRVLAQEFFSGLGTRDSEQQNEHPRTIFAVGDIKQSIYSFQKAVPEKFNENRDYFTKQAADVGLSFKTVPMNLSFRSTAAILEVVDHVFSSEENRRAISFSTDDIKHETHRVDEAGVVEIWETIVPVIKEVNDDWSPPVVQSSAEDPKQLAAEKIADQIEKWIKNKEILPSKGRAITAGDILILVQKRKEFVHYMMRALKKRNVNVAGLDQMVLTDQLAVMDLMALAKFTLLPTDDLTLAVVLKSPLIGFDEDNLFDLSYSRKKGQSLWAALLKRKNENTSFGAAAEYLTKITSYADFRPPFELFSMLLGPMGGRKRLIARLGEQANDPIDEFLNQAMKFEQNNISSMQGFMNWVENGDIKIKRDMEHGGDMVRIMTTHGAKGLQAPIVILPDTCQAPEIKDDLLWFEEKYERNLFWVKNKNSRIGLGEAAYNIRKNAIEDENKRLLYVAMTRAEDRLYVTGWENEHHTNRANGNWYDMIKAALIDMDEVYEIETDNGITLRRERGKASIKIETSKIPLQSDIEIKLPSWIDAKPPSEPLPSRPLTPSKPDDQEEVTRSPLNALEYRERDQMKYHRGRIIHKLLEILPDIAREDRQEALNRYLMQDAFSLNEADINQISKEVLAVLNDPKLEGLFGKQSRSEVPIVGQIGNYSLSGQIDRLAVLENEVLIVDYKTNRPPSKNAQEIPKIYQKQMAAYRAVLQDIYPKHKVKSFLLWTDIGSLMEIPDEILNKITF